ncbi:hypothetical protein ACP70R_003589 [Stipagrostis hirtigluma subsp. patula]
MAFQEMLRLVTAQEAIDAKQNEVMRLAMLFTTQSLASGEMSPADPELGAAAARGEATALAVLRGTAADSPEALARQAAEYEGTPVADALRGRAATVAALRSRAAEFAAFMRRLASLHARAVSVAASASVAAAGA